jgi:hypothetical protein
VRLGRQAAELEPLRPIRSPQTSSGVTKGVSNGALGAPVDAEGLKKGRARNEESHHLDLGTAMLLVLTSCASGEKRVAESGATTNLDNEGIPDDSFPDEGVTTTTEPEVARKKVGQTATLVSTDTNEEVAQVQVTKLAFSSGDEYNKPERATFLGVYIKVKALPLCQPLVRQVVVPNH